MIHTRNRDDYRTDEGSGRFYHLPGEDAFLSVTNALKLGVPSPYIAPWYAKVVAEYVDENWDDLGGFRERLAEKAWDQEKVAPHFVKMLKALPVEQRDAAGELGTQVHEVCEHIMLGGISPLVDKKVAQRVNQFVDFDKTMNPEYLAVEGIVFNRAHSYAGTFDFIADIPKVGRILVDIKTGKGVYGSAALQQTAYMHGEFIAVGTDEVAMPTVDAAFVLHLQATQWRLLPLETGDRSWSVFLSALHTARWIVDFEGDAVGKPEFKGKG